ncbi:hypothetical protein ACXN5S_19550 [Pseudoroseicyclus sp. H15]
MTQTVPKDSGPEWTALFVLAIVGIIMLATLYLQDGWLYMSWVPAVVSSLLFIPGMGLARQLRRTAAYILTLPFPLAAILSVAATPQTQIAEIQRLNARIRMVEESANAITEEIHRLRVTTHQEWVESEYVAGSYDLRTNISRATGVEIPETDENDVCFLSSLHWAHGANRGRRLAMVTKPSGPGPWRILALHSFENEEADWVQVQVMCVGLPIAAELIETRIGAQE